MSSFCKLIEDGSKHRCQVCGATFGGMVRAVCGIERKAKRHSAVAGAGTHLKKLLRMIGIKASLNCSCNAKALTMDARGVEWCEDNIETIVEWLKEEATKRSLPFMAMPAKMLVRRAIANARKEAARGKNADS